MTFILLYAAAAVVVGLLFYVALQDGWDPSSEDWWAALLAGALWPATGLTLTACLILEMVDTAKPTAAKAWNATTQPVVGAWNAVTARARKAWADVTDAARKAWNWATGWV